MGWTHTAAQCSPQPRALCCLESQLKYDCLIFDLDGTISDPKDGIVKSINYALKCHGFNERSENELIKFIGPPMDKTFSKLTESEDNQLINSLILKYRERYSEVGYSENKLYDGMLNILIKLSKVDYVTLGVCTSKRKDFAEKILELFSIRQYFKFVSGGDVGVEKWQQLQSLKINDDITNNSVMIGDRYIDITAAQTNNLKSAAVLWGFGSYDELYQHNPCHIFSKPTELLTLVY